MLVVTTRFAVPALAILSIAVVDWLPPIFAESCGDQITRRTAQCIGGNLDKAILCRREAEAKGCTGSSDTGEASHSGVPSPRQQSQPLPRPIMPAAPPRNEPSVQITESQLFDDLEAACGESTGSAIVLKILPCGEVMGNDKSRTRANIWQTIKRTCGQIRSNCDGNYHNKMLELSAKLHCDKIAAKGDVCM